MRGSICSFASYGLACLIDALKWDDDSALFLPFCTGHGRPGFDAARGELRDEVALGETVVVSARQHPAPLLVCEGFDFVVFDGQRCLIAAAKD